MYEHMPPLSFTESNELDVESNVIPLLSRSALHRSASIRSKSLIYKKRQYECTFTAGYAPVQDGFRGKTTESRVRLQTSPLDHGRLHKLLSIHLLHFVEQ